MRLGKDTKERVKRIIRDATALHPMISLRELQQVLMKRNIHIGNLNSLSALRKEITEEALAEVDRTALNEKIIQMKERYRIMAEKLFRIALWDGSHAEPGMRSPTYSEQIAAASAIINLDVKIFRTELDLGVFKKKPMTKEEERWHRSKPLSTEQKEEIVRAMESWGLVPKSQKP